MKKQSLLRQNISLLLGLTIVGQLLTATFLIVFAQKPRLVAVMDFALQQVQVVEASLEALPEPQRVTLAARINAGGYLHLQRQPPDAALAQAGLPKWSQKVLLESLPESWRMLPQQVRWQPYPNPGLWLPLSAQTGGYWVKVDLRRLEWQPSGAWGWAFLCSGLLSLAGAIVIQRRINRPLRTLVVAAEAVGQGRSTSLVESDLPPEIATLAHSFNAMQASLAQAEQERAIMLAGVSHDLRTPLTKMRLGLELLPTTDTELQQRMIRDVETINAQLGQFMDFARADVPETAVDGDLNELVHYLVTPLREQGGQIGLQLGELPIFAFAAQSVARVLQNLLDNALKYANNACEVRTYADFKWVYVEVRDRGTGLTAAEIVRLKQPFVRGEQARQQVGSGLGLTIVERILQRCGGRLCLQARQGGGLVAQVQLPLRNST